MTKFKCLNCGDCCGPVPVTANELKEIKKYIKKHPEILALKNQIKDRLSCIFRDNFENQCSIYEVRPLICRQYGRYDIDRLICPNNKDAELKLGHKALEQLHSRDWTNRRLLGWEEVEG
jgi:Fe-S-cluster containining protein